MKLNNNNNNGTIRGAWMLLVLILSICSCKKFVEVEEPFTSINGENVYKSDASAIAAITSMYAKLGIADRSTQRTIVSISYLAGLSADELTLKSGISGILAGYYTNSLTSATTPLFWGDLYSVVYTTNAAIDGLTNSNTLTPEVKMQLLGEAKFMRAFCYFYLVNLYGDVPLVLTTNYKQSYLMSRSLKSEVWQQIVSDLLDSKMLLNNNYVAADVISNSTERVRPNKWTAIGLLARTYLYMGDYTKAETEATSIINNSVLYDTVSLNNAFLKNNKEAIWQIQGVSKGWNTNDARVFILPTTGPSSTLPFYLSKSLLNSFESGDLRKLNWIKGIKAGIDSFYYVHKYKSATLNAQVTEYNTVLRLAEQYLIRAECRARQNKLAEAFADIDVIRKRARLPLIAVVNPNITRSELLNVIMQERRVELFTEWGHRWLDLKRTSKVDGVMNIETPVKGGVWHSNYQLYPISNNEVIANPNLTQTPGY